MTISKFNKTHSQQARIQRGGQGARPPPLSDHTAFMKISGPLFTYFLHSLFSIVE